MTGEAHYKPLSVGVNATVTIQGSRIGGFVAATSGSIAITIIQAEGAAPLTLPTIPVTAGVFLEMPIYVGTPARSTLVASGGASGVLLTT